MNFKMWLLTENNLPFLTAILSDPTDEFNYLVYADWLDDHDSPMVAQFMRTVIGRSKNPKGQMRELNVGIQKALPEVRKLVQPYLWTYVVRQPDYLSMSGTHEDNNREYIFYFHNQNIRFSRSTWGNTDWISAQVPGGVLIAEPRQARVASGDHDAMDQLRQEASKWEVPYIGNIVRNPPENLLHAMVLGNLYNRIPGHVRRQPRRSRREEQ